MAREPFVNIHHYDGSDDTDLDDDGDPRDGWYFQLMENDKEALSDLTGPYFDGSECEAAALQEWNSL